MADYEDLKKRVQELAEKIWDVAAIESRVKKLTAEGIPRKSLDRDDILLNKTHILDSVQRRAEEYNFMTHNCPKATALAVMEEFGLGNMEVIKALSPFPGFGGTGWMCGGVTGGLIGLGLYFASDDPLDYDRTRVAIITARNFMPRFEKEVGSVICPKIHEDVVFGHYMEPAASEEKMRAFVKAQGFEKCSLIPGIGARLAAELIIESME